MDDIKIIGLPPPSRFERMAYMGHQLKTGSFENMVLRPITDIVCLRAHAAYLLMRTLPDSDDARDLTAFIENQDKYICELLALPIAN